MAAIPYWHCMYLMMEAANKTDQSAGRPTAFPIRPLEEQFGFANLNCCPHTAPSSSFFSIWTAIRAVVVADVNHR